MRAATPATDRPDRVRSLAARRVGDAQPAASSDHGVVADDADAEIGDRRRGVLGEFQALRRVHDEEGALVAAEGACRAPQSGALGVRWLLPEPSRSTRGSISRLKMSMSRAAMEVGGGVVGQRRDVAVRAGGDAGDVG